MKFLTRQCLVAVLGATLVALSCGAGEPARPASGVAWEQSWDRAMRRAARENKVVMAFFYTEWCRWCQRMDQSTFADSAVQQALQQVVPLRLNAEGNGRAEAARFGVRSYPVTAFFDASGQLVARIPGYLPAPAFLEELGDVLKRGGQP